MKHRKRRTFTEILRSAGGRKRGSCGLVFLVLDVTPVVYEELADRSAMGWPTGDGSELGRDMQLKCFPKWRHGFFTAPGTRFEYRNSSPE